MKFQSILLLLASIILSTGFAQLDESVIYAGNGTVYVAGNGALLQALATENITTIVLMQDVVLRNDTNFPIPVRIHSGRNITITGPGEPTFNQPSPPNFAGSATLDFSYQYPYISLAPNATLILRNLVLKGLLNKYAPEVPAIVEKYPRPLGFDSWPAILTEPNSTVILTNVLAYAYARRNCSEDSLRAVILNQASVLGSTSTGYRADSNSTWVTGWHTMPITIQGANGANLGSFTLVANGTSWFCMEQPLPSQVAGAPFAAATAAANPGKGSSDSSLSTGAWIGVGFGIAAGVIISSLAAWSIFSHHRRCKRLSTVMLPASSADKDFDTGIQNSHVTALNAMQRGYQNLAVASALRIRFGSLEGLEIGHLIGRGAHGRIYKGSLRGTPVAVKVVEHSVGEQDPNSGSNSTGAAGAAAEGVAAEAVLLTALAHPKIVRLFRVSTIKLQERSSFTNRLSNNTRNGSSDLEEARSDGGMSSNGAGGGGDRGSAGNGNGGVLGLTGPGLYETWLVMEFCEKGSLHGAIRRRRYVVNKDTNQPDLPVILGILIDIAEGMEFLHSGARPVLHGDLKPANVLLKSGADPGQVVAVVADFGLSKMLDGGSQQNSIQRTTSLGTVQYMSPELLSAGRLTRAADVWAFGVIMIESFQFENVFEGMTAAQIFFNVVQQGQAPVPPPGCPEVYANVIRGCLAVVPEDRWTFTQILEELQSLRATI